MPKVWHVYGLMCPNRNQIFYVGMTSNPKSRMYNHSSGPGCRPWVYYQSLKDEGKKPVMVIFGILEDKQAARFLEARMIMTLPNLINSRKNTLPPAYPGEYDWLDLRNEMFPERDWMNHPIPHFFDD